MGRLLMIVGTAVTAFGLSAAASWTLRPASGSARAESSRSAAAAGVAHAGAAPTANNLLGAGGTGPAADAGDPAAGGHAARQQAELPVAIRPAHVPGSEQVVQLATRLQDRLAAVKQREAELEQRLARLQLVYEDIRGEQQAIAELRKQVDSEMKAVEDQMGRVEQQWLQIQQQRQQKKAKVDQIEQKLIHLEEQQRANIRRMASVYDAMDAESAAEILSKMADDGNLATAVALLGSMKERQAAKVLAALPDPGLAAQLSEKLKDLKRASKKQP